jgi:hypothetical protein
LRSKAAFSGVSATRFSPLYVSFGTPTIKFASGIPVFLVERKRETEKEHLEFSSLCKLESETGSECVPFGFSVSLLSLLLLVAVVERNHRFEWKYLTLFPEPQ